LNSRQLAFHIQDACEEKKGIDPVIIDIRKLTDIADYFVLVHGTSDRHVRTIADGIVESLEESNAKPLHREGMSEAKWVLIDCGAVMAHVFYYETRDFYNLERLWGDGKIVKPRKKHAKPVKRTRRLRPA
jgi:ribosome-associated protein